MGREIRQVPKGWGHPRKYGDFGSFIPLHDGSFSKALSDWELGKSKWDQGLIERWDSKPRWEPKEDCTYAIESESFEDWSGERPRQEDYMPDWPDEERTHIQMYETCSEGTPISPVMETPEELARWLADTGASAFADMTATYEQWLATCKAGWAPSAVASAETGLISGVEASERK